MDKIILHCGCATKYYEGYINSDMRTEWKGKPNKLDLVMPLGEPWPYADESVDAIVGMAVFQQLHWRELVISFRESFRVLKKGGVFRIGVPVIENGKPLEHLLGWENINLFSIPLLLTVLKDHIHYSSVKQRGYRKSTMKELARIDNRHDHQIYIECIK